MINNGDRISDYGYDTHREYDEADDCVDYFVNRFRLGIDTRKTSFKFIVGDKHYPSCKDDCKSQHMAQRCFLRLPLG